MPLKRFLPLPILAAIGCGVVALILAWVTRGLSPSLINPDEGGHYVNALFLGDWIRAGFPSPLSFAQDYYAHFPRLSIGHWPPGWYLLEAPIFAIFRPSPLGATCLSAFVTGLPAGAIVWAFRQIERPRLGIALGLAYLLLPLVVDSGRYVLLDQPVTLVVALAAIAWAHASDKPGWWRFLLFALFAAAAPLVKGNGALVALIPAIDIALTRRWALLRQPALWVAALLTLAVVAPWYWLSFRISAGGFNYAPGLAYAGLAIATNTQAMTANLGFGGVALGLAGATSAFGVPAARETRIARLAVAVIAATLVFQSAIPAAIDPRYITPLLPWLVVLAGLGLATLFRAGRIPQIAAAVVGALALVPALLGLWSLAPKPDLGAPALARTMAQHEGLWLVDGRAGDEGALIAAAAYADHGARRLWVSRASQWLSTSDFMGRDYRLTAKSPAEARTLLDRIGAGGVVSVAEHNAYAYPHSRLLDAAVHGGGYDLSQRRFVTGDGSITLAQRIAWVPPNLALILQNSGSANVTKMQGSLR